MCPIIRQFKVAVNNFERALEGAQPTANAASSGGGVPTEPSAPTPPVASGTGGLADGDTNSEPDAFPTEPPTSTPPVASVAAQGPVAAVDADDSDSESELEWVSLVPYTRHGFWSERHGFWKD